MAGIVIAVGLVCFERYVGEFRFLFSFLRKREDDVDLSSTASENENYDDVSSKHIPNNKKAKRERFVKPKGKYLYPIIALIIVFAIRYLSGDRALWDVAALSFPTVAPWLVALSGIFMWLEIAALFITVLYVFFDFANINNLVKFFATPVFAMGLLLVIPSVKLFCGASGELNLSSVTMALEIGIGLTICAFAWLRNRSFKISKSELVNLLLSLLPVVIAALPPYTLQLLFGYAKGFIEIKGITPEHRVFLYFAFIIPLAIYFGLRNKSQEVIRFSMVYLSLVTMTSYTFNYTFADFLNPTHWPLHLCNTAMYIVPLCLIFKWDKLFYFTYFINVMGAFLAMAMPNYADGTNVLSTHLVLFWTNHYCAFFMPLLIVALKIFQRPKLRQFIYSMVGFLIYFVFILIINGWFSNYGSVDYFFLNSDFIVDKLGLWAEKTRDLTWKFNIGELKFVYYPIYQLLFFLVYVGIAFGMWFIYEQFFAIADSHFDMHHRNRAYRQDKYALLSKLNGRKMTEPMYTEETDKLIIENFGKRYGASNVYAVRNANLEVHAGEIFGFLGPNGAGKSTIIKSIVGIQPITEGTIKVCGYDAEKQAVEAKRQIGYVPDHYALYERLTGREYINYIADIYDVPKAERDERIEGFIKLFELEGAFDNSMRTYSHGMKQKIAIMAALVHNPKLWILDEPLTGLDPNSIYQVKECMKNHAKAGNIVFFSSHIIDVVERICDRITIIKQGTILCTRSVSEFNENNTLEDFYLKTIEESDAKRQQIVADKKGKEQLGERA
ncbi:MAG: ATP-binding cassette domain-containing protein [Clostridiales bacterium]|nr:ATP-binding cassette domain-containing protein [Clostridiales bacterium]